MSNEPLGRTDEELVEDYLDGEAGAFRLLVERYYEELIRFLTRMMGDHSAAEDVFQDAFLQAHQALETFDSSRRFRPWLYTIAANKARDALRKAGRRRTVSLSAAVSDRSGASFVDLMAIDLPGPGFALDQEEQAAMVQRAIDAMTPRLREILLLAYFQKLSYGQIAEFFDIPVGTVKSRLHAAVASFAKRWQEQVEARKDTDVRSRGREK
ncbi:MAG: sigma-70 family RNA polymerase sigma factor [Phycisphaerales bacterium]|nr:sigma-70 family RNA polymerase sigma factor [Phycisphaerales bacterium]